jgi:hypothetical protein
MRMILKCFEPDLKWCHGGHLYTGVDSECAVCLFLTLANPDD